VTSEEFLASAVFLQAIQLNQKIRLYMILRNSAPPSYREIQFDSSLDLMTLRTQGLNVNLAAFFSVTISAKPKLLKIVVFNAFAVLYFLSELNLGIGGYPPPCRPPSLIPLQLLSSYISGSNQFLFHIDNPAKTGAFPPSPCSCSPAASIRFSPTDGF